MRQPSPHPVHTQYPPFRYAAHFASLETSGKETKDKSESAKIAPGPRISCEFAAIMTLQTSLFKHGHLPLILRTTLAPARSDDCEHGQRLQSRPGNEDALGVGALIGRAQQKSLGRGLG